jgi:hypothetical protein
VAKSRLTHAEGSETTFCIAVAGAGYPGNGGDAHVPSHVRKAASQLRDGQYAWVGGEEYSDWALHELELCQGMLRSGPNAQGIFFRRHPYPGEEDVETGIESAIREWYGPGSASMKDRVIYYGEGDEEGPMYRPFEFGLLVYSAVRRCVGSFCPPGRTVGGLEARWREEQKKTRERHASKWLQGTSKSTLKALADAVVQGFSSSAPAFAVLEGARGSGKSTVLARFAEQLLKGDKCLCIYAAAESWSMSSDIVACAAAELKTCLAKMDKKLRDDGDEGEDGDDGSHQPTGGVGPMPSTSAGGLASSSTSATSSPSPYAAFFDLLAIISSRGRKVVVLLDGLSSVQQTQLMRARNASIPKIDQHQGQASAGDAAAAGSGGGGVTIVITRDIDDPSPLGDGLPETGVGASANPSSRSSPQATTRVIIPPLSPEEREAISNNIAASGPSGIELDLAYIRKHKAGAMNPR